MKFTISCQVENISPVSIYADIENDDWEWIHGIVSHFGGTFTTTHGYYVGITFPSKEGSDRILRSLRRVAERG